ncbi:DUF4236 domain-containing protein [Pseudomonas sp. NY15435]|uniref:DUF4236 domain-containing protein n=1 Tax=Pseudomonas sp. NY15435 TaxID=3400358 RepID=UPI003A8C803B
MAIRFRKSIKIAPGVRLNVSKSGVSTSIGGKGLTTNLSKKGTRVTASIPGTGLSASKSYAKAPQAATPKSGSLSAISWFIILLTVMVVVALVVAR